MGRKRAVGNEWLPKGVYIRSSGYYWKPEGSTEKLCPLTASKAEVWLAYERKVSNASKRLTFAKLWEKFLRSQDFIELAPRTQKDYHSHEKYILAVFGNAEVKAIKPEHIRRYMDARGLKSKVQANHEHSSMSRVFRWGFERGYVPSNPCVGVKKYAKTVRDNYITDEQYNAIYAEGTEPLCVAMEIAYLCAARISDVLKMKKSQLLDKGVFIQQGKTGVKQIKAWNDRLQEAIKLAGSLPSGSDFVIRTSQGQGYSYNGMNDLWRKARKSASDKLGYPLDCTFHDLKAKGISDYEGSSRDKQQFSGHKTEAQVVAYDRKIKVTPTLGRSRK